MLVDTSLVSKVYMWPDLRKTSFHVHNSKTHFSPSNSSCSRWLTIQPGIDAESCLDCFCCSLFLRLVWHPRVYGSPSNGCNPLGKQTAGCNSPHDCWLMSLAMDLIPLCDMWRWKWHQWMPLGWFWWRHSLCPPLCGYPPSHPVGVLLVLTRPVKSHLNGGKFSQVFIHPIVGG